MRALWEIDSCQISSPCLILWKQKNTSFVTMNKDKQSTANIYTIRTNTHYLLSVFNLDQTKWTFFARYYSGPDIILHFHLLIPKYMHMVYICSTTCVNLSSVDSLVSRVCVFIITERPDNCDVCYWRHA